MCRICVQYRSIDINRFCDKANVAIHCVNIERRVPIYNIYKLDNLSRYKLNGSDKRIILRQPDSFKIT